MGYLTTFTVYNDGADLLRKDTEELGEKLYHSCIGVYTRNGRSGDFGHGYHANLVKVQVPRHADDHTCYVHMGNTVTEMNPYSEQTQYIINNFPDFFNSMLKHMESTVKELKKMQKKAKEEKK